MPVLAVSKYIYTYSASGSSHLLTHIDLATSQHTGFCFYAASLEREHKLRQHCHAGEWMETSDFVNLLNTRLGNGVTWKYLVL